jgi:hypothetical protein
MNNKETYDLETVEYLYKNDLFKFLLNANNNTLSIKKNPKVFGKISLEMSEIRSFITKIIFRETGIYKIILKFINNFNEEIQKINEYRQQDKLFKFYIKGNMALLVNLLNIGYYKDLKDPKIEFDPSDIDTNLFIDVSTKEGNHLENISKSLSQRMMYMYRKVFEMNKELMYYLNNQVVKIANTEANELKEKYNIKSIKKITSKDRLMYKKKGFVSRWKTSNDDNFHNIIVSFNETIEEFMLYRLFVPYLIFFKDGTSKIINAELIDLSIVKIDPNLSLYNVEYINNIHDKILLVIKYIKENKEIQDFNTKYHLEQLLWNKIMNKPDEYIVNINYEGYKLPYVSLLYLLYEYSLILINDPKDIKNPTKINKIKLLLNVLEIYLKKTIVF